MNLIRYFFEPGGKLTLTWGDGHTSQYAGNKAAFIIIFFMPALFWDLLTGKAQLRDKDKTVEIIWK